MADSGMWWTFGSLAFVFLLIAAVLWPVTSIWKSRAAIGKDRSTVTSPTGPCGHSKEATGNCGTAVHGDDPEWSRRGP